MKNFYKKSVLTLAALIISVGAIAQSYADGVFILNEGPFGSDGASLSFKDAGNMVYNNVYAQENGGALLGNTAQSMTVYGDLAYIVLNGSNAIRVVNKNTLALVTTLTEQLDNPRNIAFLGDRAYITNWGDPTTGADDYVLIMELNPYSIVGRIIVAEGPEEILERDGKFYIAHQGGFGFGNEVSVLDTNNNTVNPITIGDVPSALRMDDTNLYVLCSGKPDFSGDETAGSLVIINLDDNTDITTFDFPSATDHPAFLAVDSTAVYYTLNNAIYKMELTDTVLPSTPFINLATDNVAIPYALNKIGNTIYVGDAIDFSSPGTVFEYNEDGALNTSYTVGVLPNSFILNGDGTLDITDTTSVSDVVIYPNPAESFFKLSTNENAFVTIYDVAGRLVQDFEYTNEEISVNHLNKGVYMIKITIDGYSTTQQLIVK